MNLNYKELSDKAFYLHSNNELDKAETIYLELLEINPDDVNILNLTGLLYLAKNEFDNSISYLSKAFILRKSAYIASNLAKAYYMNNEPLKAVKMYNQALKFGKSDDIYYSLALAYKAVSKPDKTIECYKMAIKLNPKNYNALYNLTLAYKDTQDIEQAIVCAKECLNLRSNDDDVYAMLSGFYEQINEIEAAVDSLRKAVLFNNKNYIYFYNLGVLLSRLDRKKEAIAAYERAIKLNPENTESYVNLASLHKGDDNKKALEYLKIAYKLSPGEENVLLSLAQTYRDLYDNEASLNVLNQILKTNTLCAEAYSLSAMNYMDLCRYSKALDLYNKAVSLDKNNLNYLHGKAVALKYLDKWQEAKEILEYAAQKDECSVQSAVTLGMMYLTDKEFEKGMKLYTKRSRESKFKEVFKEKIWQKEQGNPMGKNILIYSDCGLGDTVMYSRFMPELKKNNKSVTLQTDKEILGLLSGSFPEINIIKKGTPPPDYDVVIPVMDLQYALDIPFEDVKSSAYLKAPQEKISEFSQLDIIKGRKNKIGLFWQGNKRIFKNRSIDFNIIKSLFSVPNAVFYSFQIDFDIDANLQYNMFCLKQYINDYSDTAALLKNMDLLITIDSSIAHTAGALGVKTWLLLPHTSEWRWFHDYDKTIWYDSIRIFHCSENENWNDIIETVKSELNKICK